MTANRTFYDALWSSTRLVFPERFNTWPMVSSLLPRAGCRLEIAPGLRPRLPIAGTFFVDISAPALTRLRTHGGRVVLAAATAIPLPDAAFQLVCAFDIIEHLANDDAGFGELARLTMPGGILLLSVPLHPSRWSNFDEIVGHCRRYDPKLLLEKLAQYGFVVERSAAFGMRPRSSRIADIGMRLLARYPRRAFWCYNNVLMPLAVARQKLLVLHDGLMPVDAVDDVLLVCRRVT